ncbi:MAG TPA: TonB-dependent receptor [Puia sp.]|nr:TonB-dependent receptor [Puia sp.]
MRKMLLLLLMCWITGTAWTQSRHITGTVLITETGNPLSGASVTIKGTKKGTVTDADGKFSLEIPGVGKTTLIVSYTGYITQEVAASGQGALVIRLSSESKQLNDVVVIGYGTVKKKDLTGAVGSVQTADIVRANPANAEQALQGQVAGVVINKSSNLPGQAFTMDIRGENTITGVTEPLVVIDGVIGGRIRDINPADIQSIDILKDASSTAIYGSRGANGVVIITSKRGASGKPRLTVDAYAGQKTPAHLPKLQTAQQFYQMTYNDIKLNGASPATFSSNELAMVNGGKSTDWVDAMTKNSLKSGVTAAVSGGGSGTTYRFSAGYTQEDGSIPHNTYKKYNLNGALDSRINKFLRLGFTAYVNYSVNPTGSLEALRSAYRARPTGVIYYKDLVNPSDGYDASQGAWNGYAVWMGIKDNQVMNPVVEANPANSQFQVNATNEMGSAFAELRLLKGLTFKSTISGSIISEKQGDYRGTYTKDRAGVNLPRATYDTRDYSTYTFDNQLTYTYTKGDHNLTVTALQSAYKYTAEAYEIGVQNLPYASLWYNLGTGGTITGVKSSYAQNTLQSYMGRINYSFKDKYLITLTGRSDGASQLAPGHKWAFFPSGAFAWRAGEEDFIKQLNIFSDLKLRVSYGQVGNANVNPYSTQATILNTPYNFDAAAAYGFAPATLGNQDLKWERSQELNLGVNMGFFDNRITAAVEVYNRKTKDLILNENLPTSSGFSTVYANVGQVGNKGVEISLSTVNIAKKDLSWITTINFARNKNKILALASGVTADVGNSLFVGASVKTNYYYKFAGIWQIKDSLEAKTYGQVPGSVRVVDKVKDGAISSSATADDRMILGTQLPDWTAGMTNRLTYKDFDLSFLIYYRKGTQFNNGLLAGTMGDYTNTRYNHIVLNYWTRNNPTNDFYGPGIAQPYKQAIYYEDASFLRISDITAGYTMPATKLEKWGVDRMRVYLQVTNPFIFTKYHGLDPEYNSSTYIDDVPTIVYTVGLNIGF